MLYDTHRKRKDDVEENERETSPTTSRRTSAMREQADRDSTHSPNLTRRGSREFGLDIGIDTSNNNSFSSSSSMLNMSNSSVNNYHHSPSSQNFPGNMTPPHRNSRSNPAFFATNSVTTPTNTPAKESISRTARRSMIFATYLVAIVALLAVIHLQYETSRKHVRYIKNGVHLKVVNVFISSYFIFFLQSYFRELL